MLGWISMFFCPRHMSKAYPIATPWNVAKRGRCFALLNFESWHFPITYLAGKSLSLFRDGKWNFAILGSYEEKSFWLPLEKCTVGPPWKKTSYALGNSLCCNLFRSSLCGAANIGTVFHLKQALTSTHPSKADFEIEGRKFAKLGRL